jgi:hypothetical protein
VHHRGVPVGFNVIVVIINFFPDTDYILIIGACANGVVDRAPVCHLGGPGSNLGQAKFL